MNTARFLCLFGISAILCAAAPATSPPSISELIVFGDSHSDTGNVFLLSEGLAAGPPYFGGRLSNGPVWVEFMAEQLGFGHPTEHHPVPAPSAAGGTNFAAGGAEAGPGFSRACAVIGGTKRCMPNIGLQIELFIAAGGVLNGDELIVVQGGGNNSSAERAAEHMGGHIVTLAGMGGKLFLVPNLDRLSQVPADTRSDTASDNFVAHFNARLDAELDIVESMFDNITILRFDLLAIQDEMIRNPEDYGLTNITEPACPGCGFGFPAPDAADTIVANPDEYMFWDLVHFTEPVSRIFGDAAADLVLGR